jgi:hypothetical protein
MRPRYLRAEEGTCLQIGSNGSQRSGNSCFSPFATKDLKLKTVRQLQFVEPGKRKT